MGLAEVSFRSELTNIFDQKVGLGNFMDSISTCVIALDMAGTVLVCNKAVEKPFRLKPCILLENLFSS